MPTAYQHRILLVVPAAKVPAVAAWLQANVDPTTPATLGPGLSPTGAAPATHAWSCAAWQDADARQLLAKLCQLASITPPTLVQWNGWSGAQKRSWLAGVQATIRTNNGVWVGLADNAGQWDDAQAALTALGLKPLGKT